jgi:ABC-2 type transport system permease protein
MKKPLSIVNFPLNKHYQLSIMWEILKFEIKYRWKRPATYIYFAIMFLLPFLAATTEYVGIGSGSGQVKDNSPVVLASMLTILSALPGLLLASGIMGVPVLRDFEQNTDALFFTTPISKLQYLSGRFLGSFLTAAFVFSGAVFGIMLGHLSPWADSDKLLPFHPWFYWQPFFTFILPNMFLMAGLFFMGGTLSKRIIVVFTQGVALLTLYLISSQMLSDLDNQSMAAIIDPFGMNTHSYVTQYWTVAEKNTQVIPLTGDFLINRLIWLSVGILTLVITYFGFSFSVRKEKTKKRKGNQQKAMPMASATDTVIPTVTQYDGLSTNLNQMIGMSVFYFHWIRKQVPFMAMVLAGVLIMLVNSMEWSKVYDISLLPTTYSMLELIGTFNLFFIIIIVSYTGEVLWKERDVKMDLIYDAMPYPNYVTIAGKFLAMIYIYLVLLVLLMFTGILIQVANGYDNFEIGLYLSSLFTETFSFLVLFTILGFLIHTLVNHKFVGHAIFVLFFITTLVLESVGIEHSLVQFASNELGQYSDMNGFGHYVLPFNWFTLYWFAFGAFFFVLALIFSVRGAETAIKMRLRIGKLRLTRPILIASILSVLMFTGTGCFIYYNTNVKNKYENSKAVEKLKAEYEKELKQFQDIPQPRITDIYVDIDIYPESRDFVAKGYYKITNKTDKPIKEIHLQFNNDQQISNEVTFSVSAGIKKTYDKFDYTIYELKKPLNPGDTIQMDFVTTFKTEGFVESNSNTEILQNGTFFNNTYFPSFGYNRDYELEENDKRKKQGLKDRERMRERNDKYGLNQHLLTDDADRVNLEVKISTSADQIAIAPGYLQSMDEKDGRRYYHYKMDEPILPFFSIVSARYEVMKDVWTSPDGKKVNLEIYYHKGHDLNLDRLMNGMKKSLDYFTKNFSPYQYRQLRIMEFPRYRAFAQSFSNTVPFSEDMGFIMDIKEEDIDFPFYVTAHEVGHQWWAHQVTEASVKGNAMLSETMSQYSALMVMKNEYPEAMMQKFLKHEMSRYLTGRATEKEKEQPLELVESQGYIHYRKGAVVMFALQDYIGEDKVNQALQQCIKDWAYKEPPYITSKDLLEYFRAVTPDSLKYIIEDMFETITLYENRTTDATYEKVGNKYKVTIDVSSVKYRADSLGTETEIKLNDWIDIGVLGKDEKGKEKVLSMKKYKINKKESTFEILVDEKPYKAGIDPINKLIDRNPDDNRKVVVEKVGS